MPPTSRGAWPGLGQVSASCTRSHCWSPLGCMGLSLLNAPCQSRRLSTLPNRWKVDCIRGASENDEPGSHLYPLQEELFSVCPSGSPPMQTASGMTVCTLLGMPTTGLFPSFSSCCSFRFWFNGLCPPHVHWDGTSLLPRMSFKSSAYTRQHREGVKSRGLAC